MSISTANWKLTAFHHVGLTVADIERSIAFYCNVLGMTLVRRRPRVTADYISQQTGYSGVEMSVASFEIAPGSRQTLEVVQYLTHAGQPGDQSTNRPGNSHLCLLVDDLQAACDAMRANGVRFKSETVTITAGPNEGGARRLLFRPGRPRARIVPAAEFDPRRIRWIARSI
ncbi:MAG: VOC family protein [Planctomycetaceae bacterium]